MNFKNRIIGSGTETVSNIVANPKNFRKHPKAQSDALSGVLDQVGWVQQVIINKSTGNLLDGHLRVEIAKANQEETIPVIYVDLTTDEEALVLATIDPIGAMAKIDKGNIEKLLNEINTQVAIDKRLADFVKAFAEQQGINMDGKPTDSEPQIDRSEELNQKWQVKPGDLWKVGEHRLLCGDSCKAEDVARVMGGEKADMVFTDPPYGIDRGEGFEGFGGFGKPIRRKKYNDGEWDKKRPSQENFDLILSLSARVFIFGGNFFSDLLPQGNHWLVWDKQNTMPTFGDCELVWTSIVRNSVKKYLFEYNGLIGKEKERFHPTQKPVGVMVAMIDDYGHAGESIYDGFLGSGTTMVAAENLKRRCFGIEISPNYCAVILERMATAFPDIDIKKI